MPEHKDDKYTTDKIRAVDAKYEAQKIAFAPLTFQAVRALLDLGLLRAVSDSGDGGLSLEEAAKAAGISVYGATVLFEIALGMGLIKIKAPFPEAGTIKKPAPHPKENFEEHRFVPGKTGWFLLEDEMTQVNFNFINDVCYKGAFELGDSIKSGKPLGLEVFGTGKKTIYEALASLPDDVKKSWFDFDHFYSDIGFEEALPIVFSGKPKKIIDIGGNTAKWAIRCCQYDPDVELLIVDLPGQIEMAEKEIARAGYAGRIKTLACDVLDEKTSFPPGADVFWMSQFLDCFSLDEVVQIMNKVRAATKSTTLENAAIGNGVVVDGSAAADGAAGDSAAVDDTAADSAAADSTAGDNSSGNTADIYILEPLWDKQRFDAASFSLQATSLYFSCMANGKSKMYRYAELAGAVEKAGFKIIEAHHNLGSNDYSLLRCRPLPGSQHNTGSKDYSLPAPEKRP